MSFMTHLTKNQMESLLELAKARDSRLHLMILLGWRHGLRASEIVGLRVGDFDIPSLAGGQGLGVNSLRRESGLKPDRSPANLIGYITVQRLKGSQRTSQALFPDELAVLPSMLAGKAPTDFLFPGRKAGSHLTYWSLWNQFQKLCHDLELPTHLAHPHVLKHTTGMTVIKQGIENCRQYLGHKSIASTGAYLRVNDEQASRAAMAAFGD